MAGFSNDISMQEYYGSFPTTSARTAVRGGSGIRKIQASPNLNAMGPSGEDRDEDVVERALAQDISPTQAGLNNRQTRLYEQMRALRNQVTGGTTTSSGGSGSTGSEATTSAGADSAKKRLNTILIVGGAAVLLGVLVYRRFR